MLDDEAVRALIVYAHPEPSSFCGALRETAETTLRAARVEVTVISDSAKSAPPRSPATRRVNGTTITFVNYVDELPFFCSEVLPRLAAKGLRQKSV